ncbi:MAG TPA: 2-phosphosulfolactate phosphatase [Candidatus Saccharimonadales bacterium]|nr:2-phosphosulfolactate phosphatase [Candidatus Saccharimonadales bacterium]
MTTSNSGASSAAESSYASFRPAEADQSSYTVRFGWGLSAAAVLAPVSDVMVVVDVVTFSTTVTVAVERDCIVYPHPWDTESASALAQELGAEVAVSRSAVSPEHPYSLSPVTLSRAPRGLRIVLPSPNGSAISAAAGGGRAVVVAGSLRNAFAVARFARRSGAIISVIAAGERWPDGSLDPALEDLIGAGAIIDGLRRRRRSPEASAAAAVFRQARKQGLRQVLNQCVSGREQRGRGYGDELEWASALNITDLVPVLREGAYRAER